MSKKSIFPCLKNEICFQIIKSTEDRLHEVVFDLFQGNSAVQIEILKKRGISTFVEILSNEDNSDLVRAKSIYALSAAIRSFPAAQGEFIAKNGLGALKKAVHIRDLAKSVLTLSSDLGKLSSALTEISCHPTKIG